MQAEIISVGTELLLGHTVNTDAAFLGRELAALGIDLHNVTVVGDNPGRLAEAFSEAMGRSGLVLVTGGLGPTLDDLTKKTLADVLGVSLYEDPVCLEQLKEYFGTRPMSANQITQAMMPEGATPLRNRIGTAPGLAVEASSGTLFMLFPGPPREMEPMFLNEAVPLLSERLNATIVSFMVRTFGLGEGMLAMKLGELCEAANPTAATYIGAHNEVFVRVTAKAATREEAVALAMPTVEEVKARLGDVVYGVDVKNLEEVVVAELAKRHEEVATAESCTGGLLAKRITDVAGASGVFRTGLVTYANETKTRLLGVPEKMLAEHGAVSPEVARSMAEGVRRESGADYGIGITGVAGPGGGTEAKPVGLVWLALSTKDGCFVHALRPQGRYPGREAVRQRSASKALDMLRRYLTGKPVIAE
ncbi:MAG: competence/damage-inducible protein A [Desulfovibrionaceae bacterium]|nr:competence/damage-inducible protein A [Desulfovibrionaceae bacterium]